MNPCTGESIFPGPPLGIELQFASDGVTRPSENAVDLYKYAVFQDPNLDWKTMDFDTAYEQHGMEVLDAPIKPGCTEQAIVNTLAHTVTEYADK